MAPLLLCFMSGLVIGAVGHWAARKLYWRAKFAPARFSRYTQRRFSRYGLRRRPFFLRAFRRDPYSRYAADYRLSRLLDRLEERHDD